jgi:hypothetical protein
MSGSRLNIYVLLLLMLALVNGINNICFCDKHTHSVRGVPRILPGGMHIFG